VDWLGESGDGTVRALVAREELLADLRARLRAGHGFAIATLNLDHAVKLRADPAFRAAYAAHSHVTADGHPIVWLERLAGRRAERVTGADLVVPLARIAAGEGCSVALVGTTAASLDGAAERLQREAPGLHVAARFAPQTGFDPSSSGAARLLDEIGESGARLCFLALGAPKQELFAARAAARLPHMGFASVGAGLDFLSGQQVRAPRAVQAFALEWAWRLARDPRRLGGRYARCAAALPGLAFAARRARPTRRGGAVP
jgi:exopolysaccharide biosynthesis WecB/TagA/CpsF family protein